MTDTSENAPSKRNGKDDLPYATAVKGMRWFSSAASCIAPLAVACLALLAQAAPAAAVGIGDGPSICKRAVLREPTRFMASAMLRKGSQDITIYLDQRIELAPNEDVALATYVRELLAEFPQHSLVSVKVNLIPPTCYYESEA